MFAKFPGSEAQLPGWISIVKILADEIFVTGVFSESLGEVMKVCEDPPQKGPFSRAVNRSVNSVLRVLRGCVPIVENLADEIYVTGVFPESLGDKMKVCEDPPRFGLFFRELRTKV